MTQQDLGIDRLNKNVDYLMEQDRKRRARILTGEFIYSMKYIRYVAVKPESTRSSINRCDLENANYGELFNNDEINTCCLLTNLRNMETHGDDLKEEYTMDRHEELWELIKSEINRCAKSKKTIASPHLKLAETMYQELLNYNRSHGHDQIIN